MPHRNAGLQQKMRRGFQSVTDQMCQVLSMLGGRRELTPQMAINDLQRGKRHYRGLFSGWHGNGTGGKLTQMGTKSLSLALRSRISIRGHRITPAGSDDDTLGLIA